MGWASGSSLMDDVIAKTRKLVKDDNLRTKLYVAWIEAMVGHDWDTIDECTGRDPAFDKAVIKLYPDWFEGE